LGSNAVVIPGVSVGADATVGATAAALRDVPDGGGVARAGR
jgi:acetyltransferase-like isoleucine patch superfamily enzyme